MSTSEHELKKIAALAYIETDPKSTHQLAEDVGAIMAFVEELRDVDTTSISPLLHPLDLHQRLRVDEVNDIDCSSDLAKIAPLFTEQLYLVPKVIDTGK